MATASKSSGKASVKKTSAAPKVKSASDKTAAQSGTQVPRADEGAGAQPALDGAMQGAEITRVLRRKEFVERIVAASGLKPNVVKSALGPILNELGDVLAAGEGLNVPPLGKITVNRSKKVGDRDILICKLRRNNAQKSDDTPLD